MFTRIRIALGLAVVLMLTTSALAKGSFTFMLVSGRNLKTDVVVTDPAVTADYFAFADFFHGKANEPASPGASFEVTRYYVDHGRGQAFDRLHYYPDSGFVYYDGLVNGWSEYDGKWYAAKPEIKAMFERAVQTAALQEQARHSVFIRRS